MFTHRLNRYYLCAAIIIILGTFIRFQLITHGWPGSFADEGTVGLMALHIAYHGAHPLLYYGQDYLGSLEAYLGAGIFHLFGPSLFALRLGLILIFALFLTCLYCLVTLLYSRGLALFSIALVGLGAPDVLLRQLMAAGGTPELFFFTTLLLLLTAWLALTSNPTQPVRKKYGVGNPRRLIAYAAWGAIAGLDIWSHLLSLSFVVCAGLLLLIFCHKEMRLPEVSLLVVFLLLGAFPLIIYKVTVSVTPDQLSVFAGVFGGGYHEPFYPSPLPSHHQASVGGIAALPGPVQQVAGTLFVAIPVATSGNQLCPISFSDAWPLSATSSVTTRVCSGVHGAWSLLLIVLLIVASIQAIRGFHEHWNAAPEQERSLEQRRKAIRHAARLMLLGGLGLILLAFVTSPPASAGTPWTSARYLVGFLITFPALLWPLWNKKGSMAVIHPRTTNLKKGLCAVLLALIFATSLFGTINIFVTQVPASNSSISKAEGLIAGLLHLGATHIYANSDDCTRLSFASNEHVICAVLDKGLQPGLDRYFPYRAMVAHWPNPAYVFLVGSPQAALFQIKAAEQHIAYSTYHLYNYDVFIPVQRIAL